MEKRVITARSPDPAPVVVPKDDSPLKIAEALRAQSEIGKMTTDAIDAIRQQSSAELIALNTQMKTVAEAVAPRPKVIDVTVTKFNDAGRPVSYRITVN